MNDQNREEALIRRWTDRAEMLAKSDMADIAKAYAECATELGVIVYGLEQEREDNP